MEKNVKETYTFSCWERYRDSYLQNNGIINKLATYRKFYDGNQWKDKRKDIIQPVLNKTRECIEKVSAKILGTPYSIHFMGEGMDSEMHTLDEFYEYQRATMDDNNFNAKVVKQALIDGTACVFTAYDVDTLGIQGLYRGQLKRDLILFENCFFENPYIADDVQNQKYLGYVKKMEVGAVKKMIEGNKSRVKKLSEMILPDDEETIDNRNPAEIDEEEITVATRFFRDESGEVMFEVSTKYVDLFEHPHYLNPKQNRNILRKKKESEMSNAPSDYENIAPAKYVEYTPYEKQNDNDYQKHLKKFSRYPINLLTFYPNLTNPQILGRSKIEDVMPLQKIINFIEMLKLMILQSHAMPKWIVKPGALKGQKITNSPSEILTDYTPYSQYGMGITRLSADTVSSQLYTELTSFYISVCERIGGFDQLSTESLNDVSGYAYQQMQKQINLTLEQPQNIFWQYIKDNARIDLVYYRFCVDSAKFYVNLDLSAIDEQQSSQSLAMKTAMSDESNTMNKEQAKQLAQPIASTQFKEIGAKDFALDWQVNIEVCQGIAGSDISTAQQINQFMQYAFSGNASMDMVETWLDLMPTIPMQLKKQLRNKMQALKQSELAQKDAEIAEYKQAITKLCEQLKQLGQQVNYQNMQLKSYQKAVKTNANQNREIVEDLMKENEQYKIQAEQNISDGEQKSMNAKGNGDGVSDIADYDLQSVGY